MTKTEFQREERYVVFKVSDLGNSLKGDEIRRLAREYAEQRRLKGKEPLECVVVEKDWPEYEPTWKAIEARVTGAQSVPEESAIQTAARVMNIELIRERDILRAKIAEMERQEPVMWANSSNINSSRINRERGGCGDQHTCSETQTTYHDTQLYALPGAKGEEK